MKKFLIVAPSYDEVSGGVVVLHKLCDLLNSAGYEAYLYPYVSCRIWPPGKIFSGTLRHLASDVRELWRRYTRRYQVHPDFETPVLSKFDSEHSGDWLVVYPEIVNGNPLGADNVIRWLLHQPGFHTGTVCYGAGELYYKFNGGVKDFYIFGSTTSTKYLKVIHYPVESYNSQDVSGDRDGVAYCIRKGRKRDIGIDLDNAILIDGMSHQEVSEVFKRVKRFVSFDEYTAYSLFAVMCGCESVVIPSGSGSEEEWYPDEADRFGIAYGLDRLDWASRTAHFQIERVQRELAASAQSAKEFAEEAIRFFSGGKP